MFINKNPLVLTVALCKLVSNRSYCLKIQAQNTVVALVCFDDLL